MNIWFAKSAILLASIVMITIRAPHGQRSRSVAVARSCKGPLEIALLIFAMLGFFIPLLWITTPLFDFAEYPLEWIPFLSGIFCFLIGLWLFYRSHADLGTNWSITLELREKHQLITQGIYRSIRHPMYLALFLYSVGQLLVIPNWFAGPSYLVTFGILFALRLPAEEKMMLDQFGKDYEEYRMRTKRLIPGIW